MEAVWIVQTVCVEKICEKDTF